MTRIERIRRRYWAWRNLLLLRIGMRFARWEESSIHEHTVTCVGGQYDGCKLRVRMRTGDVLTLPLPSRYIMRRRVSYRIERRILPPLGRGWYQWLAIHQPEPSND